MLGKQFCAVQITRYKIFLRTMISRWGQQRGHLSTEEYFVREICTCLTLVVINLLELGNFKISARRTLTKLKAQHFPGRRLLFETVQGKTLYRTLG